MCVMSDLRESIADEWVIGDVVLMPQNWKQTSIQEGARDIYTNFRKKMSTWKDNTIRPTVG